MSNKINVWYQYEGLDRCHTLLVMLDQLFGYYDPDCDFGDGRTHPAIWNDRCREALSNATSALADLYQAIGEYEDKE